MYPMTKGVSKTLTGTNTQATFSRGEFVVRQFTNAIAATLKVRVSLTKASGDAALTMAQRRTFLEGFDLSLSYGANQQHKPYNKLSWLKLAELTRFGLGSYIEGLTDSSTGLARTIASTATEVTFYLRVPFTALGWQDQGRLNLFGVGPTQARTIVIELRELTPELPTNFAISGSVTVDIIADEEPSAHDRWSLIPEFLEVTETNRIAQSLPPGLHALIFDRQAAHASNSYSDVTLTMDGLGILDKVSLTEAITSYRNTRAYFPSEADLSDYWTLIYAVPPGMQLNQLPTGKPVFTQNTHSVATMQLSLWYYPVKDEAAINLDVQEMARLRGESVHVIVGAEPLGFRDAPKAIRFALPFIIASPRDREAQEYPSRVGTGSAPPFVYVPETVAKAVAARTAVQLGNKEYAAAENTVQAATLTVPAAVQSTRGLSRGSGTLEQVRAEMNRRLGK